MALIGDPEKIEIPHEPGNYLLLRQLSGAGLDKARHANVMRQLEIAGAAGDAVDKAIERARAKGEADKTAEPGSNLDRATTLRHGVKGWEGDLYGQKFTEGAIADLDEQTASWAFGWIVERSVRPTS